MAANRQSAPGERRAGGRQALLGGVLGAAKRAVPEALRPRLGRFEPHHRPRPLTVPARYLDAAPPSPAPAVTLVMPTLNQAPFVRAALASVVAQRYPRLELVVADGGSTDGTLEALAGFRDEIARLESGPDGGQAAAINRELSRAGGEILGWLNSDDLLLPGALAHVAGFFAAHPDVDLVYGYRVLIDERGDQIGSWTMPPHSRRALEPLDLVPQETAFWRRELWLRLGGLREEIEIAFDWDFFRRAHESGARIVRLPRFLGAMRQHPGQKTRAREAESRAEQEAILAGEQGRAPSRAEVRARLLGYLLRSLPRQYAHELGARFGRRAPVPLPAIEAPAAAHGSGAAAAATAAGGAGRPGSER